MATKKPIVIEYLKLSDLSAAERDELVWAVRYQDAEFAHIDCTDDLPPDPESLELTLPVEDALAEIHQAEKEKRLRIEWKRGWLYFFYGPAVYGDSDSDAADMMQFLTRLPRAKSKARA